MAKEPKLAPKFQKIDDKQDMMLKKKQDAAEMKKTKKGKK